MKLIQDAGLKPYPLFMIGNITETEETIRDTLELDREMRASGCKVSFGYAQPYPGSEFLEVADQYGELVNRDPATYSNHGVSFVPNGLTVSKLKELMA